MPGFKDGPATKLFAPVPFKGTHSWKALKRLPLSKELKSKLAEAPRGDCVFWGLPFKIRSPVVIGSKPVTVRISPLKAPWLVFLHASDIRPDAYNKHGFITASRGTGKFGRTGVRFLLALSSTVAIVVGIVWLASTL